jgi:hypothetical protein
MRLTEILNEKIEEIIEEEKEKERRTKQKQEAAIEVVRALFHFYGFETDDLVFKAGQIDHLERIWVYVGLRGFQVRYGWTLPHIVINFSQLPTLEDICSALTNPERWRKEKEA